MSGLPLLCGVDDELVDGLAPLEGAGGDVVRSHHVLAGRQPQTDHRPLTAGGEHDRVSAGGEPPEHDAEHAAAARAWHVDVAARLLSWAHGEHGRLG